MIQQQRISEQITKTMMTEDQDKPAEQGPAMRRAATPAPCPRPEPLERI